MKRWLWAGWWLAAAVWTAALTTTLPVHIKEAVLPRDPGGVPVSKVLHVAAYAFLAGSAACLRPPGVWRWLLLIFLLWSTASSRNTCNSSSRIGRGPSRTFSSTTAASPWAWR